ncbi:MAG: AmmeMemoRadiSam system protein A [Halofilum sp. (in: g-proteobacteria)]
MSQRHANESAIEKPAGDHDFTAHGDTLLQLATQAIDHGLAHGHPPRIDPGAYPPDLQAERAAFVTLLDAAGGLRGCTGSLEPQRPLAAEASANAFNAAFRDPRFPPLTAAARAEIQCKLSIPTPLEPLPFADERDLVECLRPGVDGIAIESAHGRGTFLPAVWGQFSDAAEFWFALKRKAGLPPDLRAYRYETVTLG